MVKKQNLYFNYLGHHKVSQCQLKYQYKFCKRKLYSSLYDANNNSQSQPDKDDTATITTGTTTTSMPTASTGLKTQLLILLSFSSHNLTSPSTTKCLLKTAIAGVRAGLHCCSANVMLDKDAQQSFISQKLAEQLKTSPCDTVPMSISAFGGTSTPSTLQSTSTHLVTKTGEEVTLSVNVVPMIATPLKMTNLAVEQLPYLWLLDLAHPITHFSDFEITGLIGADFYWQVVEGRIICGNGPTTVQFKVGLLIFWSHTISR